MTFFVTLRAVLAFFEPHAARRHPRPRRCPTRTACSACNGSSVAVSAGNSTMTVEPMLKRAISAKRSRVILRSANDLRRMVDAYGGITSPSHTVATDDTSKAPTITTTKGPCAPSKWHTRRSLRANRRGIAATANGATLKMRPGTCTVCRSVPLSGMCTRW